MSIKKLAAALAVALSMATGAVQGAILSFEDDDIDFALAANPLTGSLEVQTSGTLGVGTILVSIFEIPEFAINGVNAIPAGQELTGVAAVEIVSGDGSAATPWVFQAYSEGMNAILALGTDPDKIVPGGLAGEGATIAMWFNSAVGGDNLDVNRTTNPASNCDSLADCIFEASRGDLFQVDGFLGDPDEFWVSTLLRADGDDIAAVLALNNAFLVAGFNAAQSTIFQAGGFIIGGQNIATGLPCSNGAGPDGCIVGGVISGTITGGSGLVNGAFAHSDFDAVKLTVPEPGTLALLGLGLLGVFATRRRA